MSNKEINNKTYKALLSRKVKDNENIFKLLTALGEQWDDCPSSTRLEFHGCYPGGAVEHSLNVLKFALKLNKIYQSFGCEPASTESLIKVALLHDIGKAGLPEMDGERAIPYYLLKDSDWHNKQGIFFETNKDLNFPGGVSQLSLFLLNKFGISLTKEEYLAIASIKDKKTEDSIPILNEPILSVILQQSVRGTCHLTSGKKAPEKVEFASE